MKPLKRNTLSSLIISALMPLSTAALAMETQSADAELKNTATGTRLTQEDVTTALPLRIYTRQDILNSGESNAADFIRKLPFNVAGSFRPRSGSSAQGLSLISGKGLGSSRTLVLIDGRRLGTSPALGAGADLNLIPLGAVERIEVLSSGASAIYGSDAVAGVVNVITRSDFSGVEIMLGGAEASIPSQGGEREEGSVVMGSQSERSSLLMGVSWNDREISLNRHYPWTAPGASIFSNNYTTLTNGFDNFDLRTIPGGCEFSNSGFSLGQFSDICYYDFELQAADEASIENKSFYAKAEHQVNEQWRLFASAAVRQTESFGQFAPVPGSSADGNPISANSPNNPTNPNSPLYDPSSGLVPQPVNWWHRFDALGNRETTMTNQQLDFTVGLAGQWAGVDWTYGLRHLDYRMNDVGRNFVIRSAAEQFIETGAYNLADPYGTPETILNAIRTTLYREGKFDVDEYFVHAEFNWWELPAGSLSTAIGAEHRAEKYRDLYDPQSAAEQVLGSAGNSAGIDRDVTALFMETLVPIHAKLDLRLAARHDDYSLNGDGLSTQLSLRYKPTDRLSFRLGVSEDVAAPRMDLISQKPDEQLTLVRDPLTCIAQGLDPGCSDVIVNVTYGNPELDSENSTLLTLGGGYRHDWFAINLDLYDLSLTDRVRSFSPQALINLENNGEILPNGLGCQRIPSGAIVRCFTGFANRGRVDTSGAELDLNFDYRLFGGQMANHLQLAYVHDYSTDHGVDLASSPGLPQFRATLSNQYSLGDWQFNYQVHWIDGQASSGLNPPVGSWVTHDVQANYHTPWQGKISVGAQNVGEKFPPIGLGLSTNQAYDFNLYDGFGRIVYARYTQTF